MERTTRLIVPPLYVTDQVAELEVAAEQLAGFVRDHDGLAVLRLLAFGRSE